MAEPLNESQIRDALASLEGWEYQDQALERSISFGSFREAVSFIVRVAFEAEERSHHPQIDNLYNRVTLRLTTHDAGDKVTEQDVDLAKAISAINWR